MFLHLEITSKCPLKCSACSRTLFEGQFNIREMGMQEIENIVSTRQKFNMVTLCGDHGDPIYHSHFHEVIKLIKAAHTEVPIYIATNGSFRSFAWWLKLAKLLGPKDIVNFGIDGLEHSSHIYRKGSDWNSILEGVRALRENSECELHWQWLLFRYNEKEISEGLRLAKELGFDKFKLTKSYRQEGASSDLLQPRLSLSEAVREMSHAHIPAL